MKQESCFCTTTQMAATKDLTLVVSCNSRTSVTDSEAQVRFFLYYKKRMPEYHMHQLLAHPDKFTLSDDHGIKT